LVISGAAGASRAGVPFNGNAFNEELQFEIAGRTLQLAKSEVNNLIGLLEENSVKPINHSMDVPMKID